jgi:ankyrin repeat protein
VQRYIRAGGEVNRRIKLTKTAPTLLEIAIWRGQIDTVELLLKNKADPNFCGLSYDGNPLVVVVDAHEAKRSDYPYVKIMKLLLAYGANPNLSDPWGQHCRALCDAAGFGDTEMIKLLLAAGADANATNRIGQTPLHVVENEECARLLLAAGANCKALWNGETPAEVALRDRRLPVHEFLSKECARLP